MNKLIKKVLSAVLALSFILNANCFTIFAQESTKVELENITKESRSIDNDGILGYKYTLYSTSDYGIFTSPETEYDYSTIVVDITGRASNYVDDFMNAIANASSSYIEMQNKTSLAQISALMTLLAAGPLPPAAMATALSSLSFTAEAERLGLEVNDYLLDAKRAYSYLYRYRVTENGGCVTIAGQEVCPMFV